MYGPVRKSPIPSCRETASQRQEEPASNSIPVTTLNLPAVSQRLRGDMRRFGKLISYPRHRSLLPRESTRNAAPVRNARRRANTLQSIRARTDGHKNSPITAIVNITNNRVVSTLSPFFITVNATQVDHHHI